MWLIICLIVTLFSQATRTQDVEPSSEKFEAMLMQAIGEVYQQHMNEMARPPEFNMPSDFMRSFLPNTGVGNREELKIEAIKQVPSYSDENYIQFRYKRYNNTDYVIAMQRRGVVLSKIEGSVDEFFRLSKNDAVLFFPVDESNVVLDVIMFTRFVKYSEVLYVAILTESSRTSVINIYEIIADKGVPVAGIDLGISSASGIHSVKKLAYVQSSYSGSLVVLINSEVSQTVYRQEGTSELNHYIEVFYPSAVDIVTFTIHGHGYVAVANYTTCEIFKMDKFVRDHLVFDRLTSLHSNIVDLEYFRLGFDHYLAVTGDNIQYFYTWKNGEFSLKQEIFEPDVRQLYAITLPVCRDDVILSFIHDQTIDLYIFSGDEEFFIKSKIAIPPGLSIQPGSVDSFVYNGKAILIFSNGETLQVFAIETSLSPVPDPFLKAGEEVSQQMKDIQEKLSKQTKEVERINEILRDAVRVDGDQHITAPQVIQNLEVTGGITVNKITEPVFIEWEGSNLSVEEYKQGAEDLEKDIERLEQMVKEIEKKLPDVVRLDEDSVITGRKIFTGDVYGSSIEAKSLNLQSAAGVDIPKIQKELYRLDKPQRIKGKLIFNNPLTVTGNLDVEGRVNGIDISEEIMTTDTSQTSEARMVFMNELVIDGDLEISGKMNDIDISEEVVTLTGTHHITGTKRFLNGIEADNVQTKLLDGVNLEEMYRRAFTISGDQQVAGQKTFSGGLIAKNIMLGGTLNGYNITELAESIVRTDRPATITGHKTFVDDVNIYGNLTVSGTVNGLKIPDDLVLTNKPQTITGAKEFAGEVTANIVSVEGTVDGLKIPDDIVTLSRDETILSTLYFTDGINVEKNIEVEGLVDGVDISEIAKEALKLNETSVFKDAQFLGPVTILGNLDVQGTVNGVDLKELVKDIVYRDEDQIIINSEKYFKKVVADKVKLEHAINGFNINVDFMTVEGDQFINGTKIFKQPVIFNSITVEDGLLDGVNLTQLYYERLTTAIEDNVDFDVEFVDHVIVNNLTIYGTLNGLNVPNDIVLRNSNQTIENKIFLRPVKMKTLVVDGDMNVRGMFNGLDLAQFYNDRITLSEDQTIQGDVYIGDSASSKVFISGLVNGKNINEFANNVMSKTKEQTVTASKEFSGNVLVHGPITTESVNGINMAEVNRRAFKLLEDNYVTAPMEFEDTLSIQNLVVTGDINGVNLTRLDQDSLKNKGLQYVEGVTTFESGFEVEGDIITDSINGLYIPKDVLLRTEPQVITGSFTIGSLEMQGDLTVEGLVNGLDLSEISSKLARTDQEIVINSNINFLEPIHVFKDIEVTGSVNGVNLTEVYNNVLLKTGHQFISGSKTFRGNFTIDGDIDIEYINGINWKQFLADVVRIDVPQKISAPKTFSEDIIVRENVTVTGSATTNLINGRELNKFLQRAVFIDVPANISGPITFLNPLQVTGSMEAELINGLRLKTDVLTLSCSEDGPQVITGEKTFSDLSVFGDIYTENVNSYDLEALYGNTLLTRGNQTISGKKILKGEVTFGRNVHSSTVNSMVLHRDLVTLNTPQDIPGPLTFTGDVFVEHDLTIDGLLNEVDLKKLASEALYLDTNQDVDASYHIENAVSFSDVAVQGTVNDIDLVAFDRNVTEFWNDVNHALLTMDVFSEDNCALAKDLQEILKRGYYKLDSFVVHQEFKHPASFVQTSDERVSLVLLDGKSTNSSIVHNFWDSSEQRFESADPLPASHVKNLHHTIRKERLDVHIDFRGKDSSVTLNEQPTHAPRGFTEACVFLKESKALVALLFSTKGMIEIYELADSPESSSFNHHSSLTISRAAKSIALFEISDILYLAVSKSHDTFRARSFSKIFARVNENWQRIQSISVSSSTYVKHFFYHNYHYLAFVNAAPVYETREPKSIHIYRNSGANELLFNLFQKVPFDDAKGIEIFQFGSLSELYMITWNETRIQVFLLEGEAGMRLSFTLHGKCIQDVKPIIMDKEIYLAVGQQNLKTNEEVKSVLYKGLTKGSLYRPHPFIYC